jgi:2-desacetyl-2-hydroxyethyl bacteriochlorophyllide A dehydrogenase
MKALQYEGTRDIRLIEIPKPIPKENEVRIKIKAVSICGSDINGYKGKNSLRIAPLIMGHEFSGEIECCGNAVKKFKKGMRVAVNPNLYCGICNNCKNEEFNLCDQKVVVGTSVGGMNISGAMTEYVCVREDSVIPLDEHISFEEAAILEPAAVSLHGVKKGGNLKDKKIAVIGAGPIGLLTIMLTKSLGVKRIINTDLVEKRLSFAKQCGATDTINLQKKEISYVRELTNNKGVDIVYDCVGNEKSIEQAIEIIKNRGKIVVVGMAAEKISFPIKKFVAHEFQMLGSYQYVDEIKEVMKLSSEKKIDLNSIITSVLPLEKGKEAFENLCRLEPDDIKIVLKP